MIFGLADLHLDYSKKKSMEVFGDPWLDYEEKIMTAWTRDVTDSDTVLLPGDISWAMNLEEAIHDLKRIDALSGKKIILKGNHDYWWSSLAKLNKLELENILFLQNNSFVVEGFDICGARGWMDKSNPEFSEADQVIYERELIRLELSLETASENEKIVMLHYPPFGMDGKPNDFSKLIEKYEVSLCVYGHLHGEGLKNVQEGIINGCEYRCLSADYLKFIPKKLR